MGTNPVHEQPESKQHSGSDAGGACSTCGGELQATVVRYLSEVALDSTGQVSSYVTADINDPDGYAWDHPAVRVYCENDHEVDWLAPESAGWVKAEDDVTALLHRPCIGVDFGLSGSLPDMTVADYDATINPRVGKWPLWARGKSAVPVQKLPAESDPEGYAIWIKDRPPTTRKCDACSASSDGHREG